MRRSRLTRVVAPLAIAASLALGMAGCAPGVAASSIEITQQTVILDVRTPAEFAEGHLDGALNIDVQDAGFDAQIAQLDPALSYVVYCRSGNRSAQAMERMASAGFQNLVNAGGIQDAAAATGLAVVSG